MLTKDEKALLRRVKRSERISGEKHKFILLLALLIGVPLYVAARFSMGTHAHLPGGLGDHITFLVALLVMVVVARMALQKRALISICVKLHNELERLRG